MKGKQNNHLEKVISREKQNIKEVKVKNNSNERTALLKKELEEYLNI